MSNGDSDRIKFNLFNTLRKLKLCGKRWYWDPEANGNRGGEVLW